MAENTSQAPTREEALKEAYERGLLPKDMAQAYEAAIERGLIGENKPVEAKTKIKQIYAPYDPVPFEVEVPPSEAEKAGVDVTTGAPVGRTSAGFAENQAIAADSYTKKLSEYYGKPVRVQNTEFGLEFINPENERRTLIDEEQLTFRDFEDVLAPSLPVAGAVGGSIVGAAYGLPNVGATGGAAIGDVARRWIGHLLDVRDSTSGEEAMGATGVGLLEGAMGKSFEVAAKGVSSIRRFFKPQVISAETAGRISIAAEQNQLIADEVARRTGKPFQPFTGQLANDEALLGHQQSLGVDPETAIRFRNQQTQNETALETLWDDVNPPSTESNTAIGRSVKLEARDQIQPRIEAQRDVTEQAVQDLETLTRELPSASDSTIVNEATAAAAEARAVVKGEETLAWNTVKKSIGLDENEALSNIKIPVSGQLERTLSKFTAQAKAAIDPSDAAGLNKLHPDAFKPRVNRTLNPVTGRETTELVPAKIDLWQLQRYLRSLRRQQRLAKKGEVATDPYGNDVKTLIKSVEKQRADFLGKNNPEILQEILLAESRTLERATLFDQGLVSQLLRKEQGEWMLTDSQLIGRVISSGDKEAMEHLTMALGKHPAGIPTLQKSFLAVYRNEVVEKGVPNAAKHANFMARHQDAIEVLFPGDQSLKRLGNFEQAVTTRVKRFDTFEKTVMKSFRGKLQDVSPENVINKFFTEKFSVGDVSKLMRLADAAGVGELYSSALRGQIRTRFYSPSSGVNINGLEKFLVANDDKLRASLGGRYIEDLHLFIKATTVVGRHERGIATSRRPGLLATIAEGIARSTVARPLSPHGVALTKVISFNQRAKNRAWAEIVEDPRVLRAIIANKNVSIRSETGARIIGLVGGGMLMDEAKTVESNVEKFIEEENK